jgi:ATP-dependent phosphofructokinase / diphosphate-dependent phosphofructokinase
MKIGIINSGGDVPGINAVIASAVKSGTLYGDEFIGFIRGWEGLLDPVDFVPLNLDSVKSISHLGGTILKTTNKGRFAGKIGEGSINLIPREILEQAFNNAKSLGVEALLVIGGDGTLTAAIQLANLGLQIIGVPKTIDNDLSVTERTFGYSTAVELVVESLGRLHTTAESHDRIFVVETMGRYAGWLALEGGLGGGASAILIPEIRFSYEKLYEYLLKRKDNGKNYSLVVVSEGAMSVEGERVTQEHKTSSEVLLGGIADEVAQKIREMSRSSFEVRSMVLGHLQRGGNPNAADIILSQAYGTAAIRAIHEGRHMEMVALISNKIKTVPISDAVRQFNLVTPDSTSYITAKSMGIFMGQ